MNEAPAPIDEEAQPAKAGGSRQKTAGGNEKLTTGSQGGGDLLVVTDANRSRR